MTEAEKPTTKWRDATDQIFHFWPLLVFLAVTAAAIVSTLGQVYVSDIARETYSEVILADPLIQAIKTDIVSIRASLSAQVANDVEIRTQLSTIETRLDTLIAIQLGRDQ